MNNCRLGMSSLESTVLSPESTARVVTSLHEFGAGISVYAQTYAPLFQLIWYGVWRKLFGSPREEASDLLGYGIFLWSSNHLGHLGYLI